MVVKMSPKLKHSQVPIPKNMESLERTDRGYLKPWFVKGDDFRVVDTRKAAFAVTKKACWICGKPFTESRYAMVCSPVSAMFRVFKEPPCHIECAEYAIQVCPFLLYPNSKRREAGLPEDNKLESVNQTLDVKISAENPGEYYLVEVDDFTFDQGKQVMTCDPQNVIGMQYWIGGNRQKTIPNPIVSSDVLETKFSKKQAQE